MLVCSPCCFSLDLSRNSNLNMTSFPYREPLEGCSSTKVNYIHSRKHCYIFYGTYMHCFKLMHILSLSCILTVLSLSRFKIKCISLYIIGSRAAHVLAASRSSAGSSQYPPCSTSPPPFKPSNIVRRLEFDWCRDRAKLHDNNIVFRHTYAWCDECLQFKDHIVDTQISILYALELVQKQYVLTLNTRTVRSDSESLSLSASESTHGVSSVSAAIPSSSSSVGVHLAPAILCFVSSCRILIRFCFARFTSFSNIVSCPRPDA